MGRAAASASVEHARGLREHRPVYELRVRGGGGGRIAMEITQLPSASTPRLVAPERTASLAGRALEIVEGRVLRQLKHAGIRLPHLARGGSARVDLDEDLALTLALMFRTLAPMRSLERMAIVAEGIDRMSREEAGYWLGMAVHRRNPRRVLAALRILLAAN